ncbi:MAG: hypothetical protein EA378_03145 [Phycisphaerales bacterium]|nr:MAG: hypothetical protein EA378_03145 [Phycisphaerales bacterium]
MSAEHGPESGVPPADTPLVADVDAPVADAEAVDGEVLDAPPDGVTHSQEKAIIALLAEPTIARAARAAGVGERTLHRWMREPVFARAYRAARREAFAQAIAGSHRIAAAAVQTLARIMVDPGAPYAARVQAAGSLLRFSREAIELDDLAGRVDDLERLADGDDPGEVR